jgi:hypothetical protein
MQEYAETNFTVENLNRNKKRRRKNYIPMAADREVSGLNGKMEKHETSLIPLLNSRDWK